MRADPGYSEEGFQGKPYDPRLLARLLPFLRPYRRLLIGSVLLVVAITLFELALPFFSKIAIDRFIVPQPPAGAGTQGANARNASERLLTVDLENAAIRAVVERHPDLFRAESSNAVIAFDALGRLPLADRQLLRQSEMAGLGLVVGIFLLVIGADFGLTFLQRVIMEKAGHRVMHDMRLRLYDHLQQQGLAFFTRQPVARLVTRVTNDVQNMHDLFTTFVSMVFKDLFLLVGIAAVMLALDWRLTLAGLAVLPLVLWAALGFSRRARDVFRALRVKVSQINTQMAESIDGIRTIQTFAAEEANYRKFTALNAENYRLGMREIHMFGVFMPIIEVLGLVAVAIVVVYGGVHALDGRISIGVLVASIAYIRMFFRPLRDLAENYNVLQNALASAERIFGLLDTDERLPRMESPAARALPSRPRLEQVELDHVSFAYTAREWVLRDVSFTVRQGQTVALVGPTGAGKTSVLNLIQRFYDPAEGQVRVNGVDVRQWEPSRLRALSALVPQDPQLFSGTLRENIFADRSAPDRHADDAIVARTIAAANCSALVRRMPRGLDTYLDKGGAGLSSGERQLVTIARALARDPQLILLDEATSYIDSHTEAAIHDALHNLMQGRTSVIVAHRLSTARTADIIVVMQQGRVVETGPHDELMARAGLYWRLNQQSALH